MAASSLATVTMTLALSQLRHGHEATPPVNIRAPEDGPEMKALAANIADRIAARRPPLIEPLLVIEGPKPRGKAGERSYYVCDGGRRLTALQRLRDQGIITDALHLPVVEHARGEGLEVSTTAAVLAAPHHPVDQYEAFASLIAARGSRPEEETVAYLARRFAITARRVRQINALGALAPEVRAAWRAGRIDKTTAQAFTLSDDPARQATVLEAIEGREGHVMPARVRQMMIASRIAADSAPMHMVGLDAYLAAGGTLTGDLFSAERFVADEKLFGRLYKATRTAVEKAILAEGWGFVFWKDQPEAEGWYRWTRRFGGAPVFTPEAAAEIARLKTEIAALDATAKAALANRPDEDDGDWGDELAEDEEVIFGTGGAPDEEPAPAAPTLAQERATAVARLAVLEQAADRAGYAAEDREGLAVLLYFGPAGGEASRLVAHAGYVPPGLDKGEAAEAAGAGDEGGEDDGDLGGDEFEDGPQEPGSEDTPSAGAGGSSHGETAADLPRAARQSLSLVANRAAAATIAADADLALTLLAAAWIAREEDIHGAGNGVPLIVSSRGLGEGPAGDLITTLAAGEAGRPDRWQKDERAPHFAGLAAVIAGMARGKRLELVAALAAAALDLSHDTIENRSGSSKHVKPDGVAALLAALPAATFNRNAQLILAGAGEAEAIFADWGKAHLVEAIRAMDGDDAAKQAVKAKKPDLVALVAERARATGWLPVPLRLASPAQAEGGPSSQPDGDATAGGSDEQEPA